MKTTITVGDEPTQLIPAGTVYDFITVQHRAGDAIYVDFVDGGTGLTDANGIQYGSGETVITLWNSVNPQSSIFANGLFAICAAGESATVVVQYA
jgi:hypothetical protein